jgi:hypothetical protein
MQGQGIVDTSDNSLQKIIAGVEEADYKLMAIYDVDVFNYFDFGDDNPDTDLKKQLFKKKPEYAEKLSELKKKKSQFAKTDYYVKLDDRFESNDYNIKRKGFDIVIGENVGNGTLAARAPKSIGGILLSALPTKNRSIDMYGPGIYEERMFLQMNEENGLEIENNSDKIIVYFIFHISGKQSVQFKYMCRTYGWYNMTQKLLFAEKVRVVVANRETGKVYYDKIYK